MAEAASRARRRTHEPGDVDPRPIVFAAAGLAATLVLVAAVALGTRLLLRPDRAATARAAAAIPAPQLQSAPAADLRALVREKNAMLDEYRWIDPHRGVVRIPIDRAMQLLAERGARSAAPSGAAR